jgi:hypothetical protein
MGKLLTSTNGGYMSAPVTHLVTRAGGGDPNAWRSHSSVDTFSTQFVSRLKLFGSDASEMTVARLLKNDSATALSQQFSFRLMLGSR